MSDTKRLAFVFLLLGLVLSGCGASLNKEDETELGTETIAEIELPTATMAEPTIPPEPTEAVFVPGTHWISQVDGMEMVYIPGGEFSMGWTGMDATIVNGPGPTADFMEFVASVEEFWIDKYEVSNGQYQQCVAAGACRPCNQNNIPPQGKDYFMDPVYADYPVVNVSWYMARDYCAWAERRLPTEAEWEKAARGTDARKYPWGNENYSDTYANMCDKDCPTSVRGEHGNPNFDDGFPGPAPVGSFPAGASPYGVLDMAGNVWEWTATAEKPYPYNATDGRESEYDIEDGSKWPERILRGGPWNDGYAYMRSSFRYRAVAIYWNFNMGFRCAYSE